METTPGSFRFRPLTFWIAIGPSFTRAQIPITRCVLTSCNLVAFVVNALRKLLDNPIVLAKSGDDDPAEMRAYGSGDIKQHNRKRILISPDSLPMFDLVRGLRSRRKEALQQLGRSVLASCVGQHHDSGLVVLRLPGMKKAIRGGKRRTVAGIDCAGGAAF